MLSVGALSQINHRCALQGFSSGCHLQACAGNKHLDLEMHHVLVTSGKRVDIEQINSQIGPWRHLFRLVMYVSMNSFHPYEVTEIQMPWCTLEQTT